MADIAAIDPAIIERLKAEHSDVHVIRAGGASVAVKSPGRGEYKRFRAMSGDEKKRPEALEVLAKACVVYPDAAGFEALLERKPVLADVIGGKLLEIAGLDEAEAVKQ